MPDAYEQYLVPVVFRPFAEDLAARATALHPGRVLELAAGTGALTSILLTAAPSAEVTATDLNEAMVAFGSARAPGAAWRRADAQRLPFPDGGFDLVVCQFGVMFFPDRVAAFTEVRRVLAPSGRFLFNTWGPIGTHGFESALQAGLDRACEGPPPPVPPGGARRSRPTPGGGPPPGPRRGTPSGTRGRFVWGAGGRRPPTSRPGT
ncbi:class I SAM-dependent methyltransferase [Streptomyces sp. NPDC059810]|uniref:class I SAM-dependent methyltransferase n=1 Tax=Streptomyces sp. NPDC059810 TaxID=3346956 RepID=UPI003669D559